MQVFNYRKRSHFVYLVETETPIHFVPFQTTRKDLYLTSETYFTFLHYDSLAGSKITAEVYKMKIIPKIRHSGWLCEYFSIGRMLGHVGLPHLIYQIRFNVFLRFIKLRLSY